MIEERPPHTNAKVLSRSDDRVYDQEMNASFPVPLERRAPSRQGKVSLFDLTLLTSVSAGATAGALSGHGWTRLAGGVAGMLIGLCAHAPVRIFAHWLCNRSRLRFPDVLLTGFLAFLLIAHIIAAALVGGYLVHQTAGIGWLFLYAACTIACWRLWSLNKHGAAEWRSD